MRDRKIVTVLEGDVISMIPLRKVGLDADR